MTSSDTTATDAFTDFFATSEPRLRHALMACCGAEIGREAAADALEYAWSHWDRVQSMDHPVAYLYRVGRSASRKYRRRRRTLVDTPIVASPWVEPGLGPALDRLSDRQRVAVMLRHSFGYTLDETAQVMGISISSVQTHVDRGLAKLRRALEVSP
jgi:DNA-directed RNA polymerase specialized sigma24 family protein